MDTYELIKEREDAKNRLLSLRMTNIWNMPDEELIALRVKVFAAELRVQAAEKALTAHMVEKSLEPISDAKMFLSDHTPR